MNARNSFLLLVAAGVLWGTGGVTGHGLADTTGLSAPAIAGYRLGVGGLILTGLLLIRRPVAPVQWRPVGATAVLAALFQCAYFGSVAVGTVSTATLITIGSSPIFVLLIQAIRDRRRPAAAQLRTVALGVVGLALLVGSPAGGSSLLASLGGATLAALSGLAFAVFTMYRARPSIDDPATTTALGFLIGGILIGVVVLPFQPLIFHPTAHSLGLLLLFATVPTALAYTLFFRGLAGASASVATVVALLEPLTGTVLAVIIFGDRLTWLGVVGALLLLLSVVDAGRSRRPVPVEV